MLELVPNPVLFLIQVSLMALVVAILISAHQRHAVYLQHHSASAIRIAHGIFYLILLVTAMWTIVSQHWA